MRHLHDLPPSNGTLKCLSIGNIALDEGEPIASLEAIEPRHLESGIVIGIKIIDADHFVAPLKQGTA